MIHKKKTCLTVTIAEIVFDKRTQGWKVIKIYNAMLLDLEGFLNKQSGFELARFLVPCPKVA